MCANSGDDKFCAVCRKCFVLHIAGAFTVNGVGGIRAKLFDVHLVYPTAYFFIWRKQYPDGSVFDLRVTDQLVASIHNFGITSLIISAEQRCSARSNDIIAHLIAKIRMFGQLNDL